MSARSLNRVQLIGNLTRDPNLRYTPSNTAVCSFGMATNRTWTAPNSQEKQEKTEFHNVVAWGKLAEICEKLLSKGDKVFIEGRIQTRDWKTDQGDDRRVTEIVAEDMMLLNFKNNRPSSYSDDNQDSYNDEPDFSQDGSDSPKDEVSSEDVSDDIPF